MRDFFDDVPDWRSIHSARSWVKQKYDEINGNPYQFRADSNGNDILDMIRFLNAHENHEVHFSYDFHPYSNVDTNEIELIITYENVRNEVVDTLFSPTQEWKNHGMEYIQTNDEIILNITLHLLNSLVVIGKLRFLQTLG